MFMSGSIRSTVVIGKVIASIFNGDFSCSRDSCVVIFSCPCDLTVSVIRSFHLNLRSVVQLGEGRDLAEWRGHAGSWAIRIIAVIASDFCQQQCTSGWPIIRLALCFKAMSRVSPQEVEAGSHAEPATFQTELSYARA